MTNAEADALIATLPKPRGLRIYREGAWIMMTGGKSGSHEIAVGPSNAARLIVHWRGYAENQDPATARPARAKAVAAALAGVSPLARKAYRALCVAKGHALLYGTIARKVHVGRWKTYGHENLGPALDELTRIHLVTSDGHGRWTALCDGEAS